MTCKDCIHWKACKNSAYDYYGEDAASAYDDDSCCKAFAEICENFSDKSELVRLPCKAGDTIFLPWEWDGENGIARITVLRVVLTEYKSYIETDFDSDDYDYFMKYNCGLFWFEDFGKMVFAIKEEAEKALEKMSRK